jgi:hypothetical protein
MSDFLPKDYKIPKSVDRYWNKFEKGSNKFRILGPVLTGWEWWVDDGDKRKPMRVEKQSDVPAEYKKGERETDAVHFWKVPVYDYGTGAIRILSIKQVTVQRPIAELSANEDWGSPTDYDITVTKSGDGFETEYSVVPSPKKPMEKLILDEYKDAKINMEALLTGDDPFAAPDTLVNLDEVTEALGDA